MAANLLRAGVRLCVYNRSPAPTRALATLGADIALSPDELFKRSDVIILMLADDAAVDAVLGRCGPGFASRVGGRLIVNMGTHAPEYSSALESDVLAAGGRFVEAPVSGSRGPAEAGDLVAMAAGAPAAIAEARSLFGPLCREVVEVGAVPGGMAMKLAVNLYLITSVTALAEATSLATATGVDLERFQRVIAGGPLGSGVASAKLGKMVDRDFTPQAAMSDVVKNARLVANAVRSAAIDAPLLDESRARFERVAQRGDNLDMAAILMSYERESSAA